MNHRRHQAQHAAGPLEFVESGPVVVQPVEQLRVDRICRAHPALILRFARFGRELLRELSVLVRECLHYRIARSEQFRIGDGLEQTPPNNFKPLFGACRTPRGLDAFDHVLQSLQRSQATLAADLVLR